MGPRLPWMSDRENMAAAPDRLERFMRYVAWVARLGPTAEQARQANEVRDRVLAALAGVRYAAGGSKPHLGPLSPGCECCGQGTWSCLFINGLCTANCFYCPQDRDMREERGPIAEELPFDHPASFVDYLRRFGFRGVSFSGGEPLITFDRVITYLAAIRAAFGREMVIWLYTNGDLVDARKLAALRDEGLDEIRFDIAAREYRLEPVALAREYIPIVTVEIPAIPEDMAILERSLATLSIIGADHVNLHQLVATEHNYARLRDRGYTFLPPLSFREPPVLESELAALSAMAYAAERGLALPINYCSHAYKARYQNLAGRRRAAGCAAAPAARITDAGYLARWSVSTAPEALDALASELDRAGVPGHLWARGEAEDALILHETLLEHPALGTHRPELAYFEADIRATPRPGTVREIALAGGKTLYLTCREVARGTAAKTSDPWERLETGLQPISARS